jgi:hypothetical protein
MFAIEATNPKKWRWIAAIFHDRHRAEAFLQSVPETARPLQHIVEIPVENYPVFVVEDQGFEYGDLAFVRAKLKGLTQKGDEDFIHLNVYAVKEDFSPDVPGIDGMGSLLHWHVTDDTLQPPRSVVFDEELEEIASLRLLGEKKHSTHD